jgi:hypothetical protein
MSGTLGPLYVGPGAVYTPGDPTVLQAIIPAYPYIQYADDDDIQAFFAAQNEYAGQYLLWYQSLNFPIYTGDPIDGTFLDYVGTNLYGIPRPYITTGSESYIGATATFFAGELATATRLITSSETLQSVSDDIYRRVITWNFYKGDGFQFSIPWLKRRINRFMFGVNGIPPNPQDNTYAVSISVSNSEYTILVDTPDPSPGPFLNALMQSGLCYVPFMGTFSLTASTNLVNASGVLEVNPQTGYPTSAGSLPPGSVWSNAGVVNVVPGVTPNPDAPEVVFGAISSLQLLELGGGNLPTTAPTAGSLQLWNNDNVVNVA